MELLNSKNESDNKIITNNNINKIEINNNLNNNPNNYEKIIIDYILDFDSVFAIKKVFTNLEIDEIKNILKKYLQTDNTVIEKKNRIKFILKKYKLSKEEDFYDKEFDFEKVKKKLQQNGLLEERKNFQNKINYLENNLDTTITKNFNNNLNNNFNNNLNNNLNNNFNNNSNENILKLLNEINNQLKTIKSDILILNSKIDIITNSNYFENKKINNSEDDLENEFNKYI